MPDQGTPRYAAPSDNVTANAVRPLLQPSNLDSQEDPMTRPPAIPFLRPATIKTIGSALLLIAVGATLAADSVGQTPSSSEGPKMLRHVVLFQFKSTSSEADVKKVVDAFRKLRQEIPQIADFEYGVNNSPEGLNGGLTHCFLVTFKSEADRDAYLPHPAHKRFVDLLKPHLEKATVVDYWAQQ